VVPLAEIVRNSRFFVKNCPISGVIVMPRSKKPPGHAVDKRNGQRATLSVISGEKPKRPPAPGSLRADARKLWVAYWDDVLAGIVQPAEIYLVRRWVANVNRYLTLMATADAEPIVEGSQGQTRAHPAYTLALKLEDSIRADEAQLGYGPKNRAALGIAVVEQKRSLADLNTRYGGADGRVITATDDHADERDPRTQTG